MARKTEKTDDIAPNPLMELDVEKMIRVVRGKQVLLDRDLATLYGVETKRINEQVRRNIERFPEDFCIQLSLEESQLLRSQNAALEKKGQNLKGKHTKYRSLAFTEQGVAMLSSVLKSETAIKVNIAIMRAFVQLRHLMMGNGGLINRLSNVEAKDLEQVFQLSKDEVEILRTKISSTNYSAKSRSLPYAFTEKGLYMLATILKSKTAINTTFAIIETFAAVRELKRELVELHKEGDKEEKHSKMQHFGEILTNIVMPDLETTETESLRNG